MSEFRESFVNTITDIYHFDNKIEFYKFLRSNKAKEILSLTISENMTKEEYDKKYAHTKL